MSDQNSYITIRAAADAEFEEKKSLFIGHAKPVATEAEALAFLSEMRSTYADATHNVYAYVLRENSTVRYSDDREPQGTAGMPVLDVLRKAGIVDAAIVVTRYFGGTLLGTGGLVHAYTRAARMAVEAAEVVTRARLGIVSITVNYSDYQKILPVIDAAHVRVDDSEFAGDVRLTLALRYEEAEEFMKRLFDVCNGRADCRLAGDRFDYL
jgi:uncharacterized YigZ family protein